jgi:homoserine kinase type II
LSVKLKITQKDLPKEFRQYNLYETQDGISQTVYFLDDLYVLKIFEDTDISVLENELNLLRYLNKLQVCKPLDKIFYIKQSIGLIYYRSNGRSLKDSIKPKHIKQIAIFLKNLHKKTINRSNSNIKLFAKSRVKILVNNTKNQNLIDIFNSINIDLKEDGIIHGDLFVDNCSFYNDKLEIVYDWSEACVGDFIFDLAVVALSWCRSKKDIDTLLISYDYKYSFTQFRQYIKYASLYYCTNRFLANKKYQDIYYDNLNF